MSNLNIDQKTIFGLLTDKKKADFLIPDYQRPYAWGEEECETFWDDLRAFAIPNDDITAFDESEEYFLGCIVAFENSKGQQEIIDGQQRLTTILLLLRAFCARFEYMKDPDSITMHADLEKCIWKTGSLNKIDKTKLKLDSEVASDDYRQEFLNILNTGVVEKSYKSQYAKNYLFFEKSIDELISLYPKYVADFAWRILNNVILLPIEAESQETALRIFSTLNDRGKPLADADIFKSQFYKYYSDKGEKDAFIARWKKLEEGAERVFHPQIGTPMDDLFSRYMYYRRAKKHIHETTTQALRDFFSTNSYEMLKNDEALGELETLLDFWDRIDAQKGFSDRVKRQLFVLNYAPNGMWTYLVSVYYLANRDAESNLSEPEFYEFLQLITGFIYAYALERPGVNALRGPVYPEMEHIVDGLPVTFEAYKFDRATMINRFKSYAFTNQRRFTRSMLVWWMYQDPEQKLLDLDTTLEVEHIYARKRAEVTPLADRRHLEALGNKAMLEKRVNIRAADFRFEDKRKYYLGYVNDKGEQRSGTAVNELVQMVTTMDDFTEADIEQRTDKIINAFVDWLGEVGLLRS